MIVLIRGRKGFPGDSVVKNPPANSGDTGSIPGLGRSPGEGNGNLPPYYSCLGNPVNRGAWQATVHRVTKGQTWLSDHTTTSTIRGRRDWNSLHHVRGCSEKAVIYLQTRRKIPGTSPGTNSADTLVLDFSASRTVRNRWLLFKWPS